MVRLWDTQTGASGAVLSSHTNCVTSVAYSPSGQQIASGSYDKTVRGNQIASGSYDHTVRLWDTQTDAPGAILWGHAKWVTSVAYSPSGQHIASGSWDHTVQLWDVKSGQCLVVVDGFHGYIPSIAWRATSDGTYFATSCGDKSVRVWQLIGEGDDHHVRLKWSSNHGGLVMSSITIQEVQGLSRVNAKLLLQRGAVGDPVRPLTFRGASEKLITMANAVSARDAAKPQHVEYPPCG
ncbi:hypothetical protein BGZ54_002676 [Gamsiella multidivaricata]|nr:hypothetical protein BGZ54_002676 [Gamsiella multidivaricata]